MPDTAYRHNDVPCAGETKESENSEQEINRQASQWVRHEHRAKVPAMTQTTIRKPGQTTTQEPESPASAPAAPTRTRHTRLHAQIISYLARHGASRLSDILTEVEVCRATLFVHLAILEDAEIIQCDRPKGARRRSTPFYSLRRQASTQALRKDGQANLTARIKEATDGKIAVTVDEIPGMLVHSRTFDDIPGAVATAARARREEEGGFTVQVVI